MGDSMLNWITVQCRRIHVRRCDSAITRFYEQMSSRRGEKIAIVAAARRQMRTMCVRLKEEKALKAGWLKARTSLALAVQNAF